MDTTELGGRGQTAFGAEAIFTAGVQFREDPADDVFCEMSEAAAALTGYTRDELTLPDVRQDLIFPEDRSVFLEARRKVLAGEPTSVEIRLVTKRGEKRWLKLIAEPRIAEDGHTFGMLMTGFDVTSYKVDQEAWRSAVEFASERAAHRASSLVASEARLERLASSVTEFLGDDVGQVLESVDAPAEDEPLAGVAVDRYMAAVGRLRSGAVMLQRLLGVSRAFINREKIDVQRFLTSSSPSYRVDVERDLCISIDKQILAYIFESLEACRSEARTPMLAKARADGEIAICLLGVPAAENEGGRACDRHAINVIHQAVARHGGKAWVDRSLGHDPCLIFDFGPDSVW